MVLAAGLGLRMRPLTLLRAKPALPVLNRPLLALDARAPGARRGARGGRQPAPPARDDRRRAGRRAGASACGSLLRASRTILGTGGGPRAVRECFGDEPVLLVNGDVLFDFDLRAARRRATARSGARATLALRPNPGPRLLAGGDATGTGRILSIAGPAGRGRAARSRCSRASTSSTRPSSSGCPTGPPTACSTSTSRCSPRARTLHGVPRRGRVVRFRPPVALPRRAAAAAAGPRPLAPRRREGARRARPRGSAARWSARGARVACRSRRRAQRAVGRRGRRGGGARVALDRRRGRRGAERGAGRGVIVLPAEALATAGEAGGACERHGDMAWVELQ